MVRDRFLFAIVSLVAWRLLASCASSVPNPEPSAAPEAEPSIRLPAWTTRPGAALAFPDSPGGSVSAVAARATIGGFSGLATGISLAGERVRIRSFALDPPEGGWIPRAIGAFFSFDDLDIGPSEEFSFRSFRPDESGTAESRDDSRAFTLATFGVPISFASVALTRAGLSLESAETEVVGAMRSPDGEETVRAGVRAVFARLAVSPGWAIDPASARVERALLVAGLHAFEALELEFETGEDGAWMAKGRAGSPAGTELPPLFGRFSLGPGSPGEIEAVPLEFGFAADSATADAPGIRLEARTLGGNFVGCECAVVPAEGADPMAFAADEARLAVTEHAYRLRLARSGLAGSARVSGFEARYRSADIDLELDPAAPGGYRVERRAGAVVADLLWAGSSFRAACGIDQAGRMVPLDGELGFDTSGATVPLASRLVAAFFDAGALYAVARAWDAPEAPPKLYALEPGGSFDELGHAARVDGRWARVAEPGYRVVIDGTEYLAYGAVATGEGLRFEEARLVLGAPFGPFARSGVSVAPNGTARATGIKDIPLPGAFIKVNVAYVLKDGVRVSGYLEVAPPWASPFAGARFKVGDVFISFGAAHGSFAFEPLVAPLSWTGQGGIAFSASALSAAVGPEGLALSVSGFSLPRAAGTPLEGMRLDGVEILPSGEAVFVRAGLAAAFQFLEGGVTCEANAFAGSESRDGGLMLAFTGFAFLPDDERYGEDSGSVVAVTRLLIDATTGRVASFEILGKGGAVDISGLF